MSLKTYLYRCKRHNARWLFWLVVNSLCLLANGHLSAQAMTSLVAQDLHQFALFTGLTFLVYLIWGWQIKAIAPARERAIQAMNQEMRADILNRLAKTDLATVQNLGSQNLTSWLTNDITTINDLGLETLELMLTQALNISFSALSLMAYHPSFAVTVLVLSWLMSRVPGFFDDKMAEQALQFSKKQEDLLAFISQTLRGFPLFYSAGRLDQLHHRIKEPEAAYGQSRVRYQTTFGRFMAWQNSLSFLSQLTVLTQASLLFAWDLVPIGAVSSSPYFASVTFAGLTGFFANWAEVKATTPLWQKFSSLPQVPQQPTKHLDYSPGEFSWQELAVQVSDHVNLTFPDLSLRPGQTVLVTGPSGRGKSSLLNLLGGRLVPNQGQISYQGQILEAQDLLALVSLVDQEPFIFDDSLRYNLTLGQDLDDQHLLQGLHQLGLTDLVQQLPQGLDSPISLDSLSGGQAQRLCLLRGLLQDRPILLLDEVTANLDAANQQKVQAVLDQLTDKIIIWVSHQNNHDSADQLLPL